MQELLQIMARLRAGDGCPWDREQTFSSIAPHTLEEAYEVVDAIARDDMPHLKDELGDLLFQVVFHAQMASEAGLFDFDAVAGAICDKLTRRHPHVFGDHGPMTAAEQSVAWEDIKARERDAAAASRLAAAEPGSIDAASKRIAAASSSSESALKAAAPEPSRASARASDDASDRASDEEEVRLPALSHLDGVPLALPALMRAYKLSKRAARVGFDFERASQTADKVAEELAEVREGAAQNGGSGSSPEIFEEVGDLLFAAANLARKLDVDAEAALRAANAKFERRFRGMEALASRRREVFAELNLDAQERLWQEVKRDE